MREPGGVVVVLHARQVIGVDLLEVFPPERFEVCVLTSAREREVFRPGTPNIAAIRSLPREAWGAWVRSLAGEGARVELVSNDEYCVEDCAALRALLGARARHPEDLTGYRDKVVMKTRLRAAGVDVPPFASLDPVPAASPEAIERLLAALGLPVVVKPRQDSNNRGVEILADRPALATWLAAHTGLAGWQVESHVAGRMLHANALVQEGVLTPLLVGQYTDSLLALGAGRPVGSITLAADDDGVRAGEELNAAVVGALGGRGSFVIHTEFVLTPGGRSVLLETAARAPGALVSEMAALHCGVHLERAGLRVQAGEAVAAPRATGQHALWMWFPRGESAAGIEASPEVVRRPELSSDYRLQVFPGRSAIGASLLAWNRDLRSLRDDLAAIEDRTLSQAPRGSAIGAFAAAREGE
jgi:biotin carboxylase